MSGLYGPILLHTLVGFVLAAVVWLTGFGILALRVRPDRLIGTQGAFAYPVGLLVLLGLAFAIDVSAAGGLFVMGGTVALSAWGFLRRRPLLPSLAAKVARPVLLSAPFVVVLSFVLGAVWHGPSTSRGVFPDKDFLWYVSRAISARHSVHPIHNLDVLGDSGRYLDAGAELMSGALAHIPGFDAFLFFGVSLPVCAFASYAVALPLLLTGSNAIDDLRRSPLLASITSLLLATGATAASLSYLVASPPAALLLPTVFALAALVWGEPLELLPLSALTLVLVLDALETKTVAILPVAWAVGWVLLGGRSGSWSATIGRAAAVGSVTAAVCAIGVAVLNHNASWQIRQSTTLVFRPSLLVAGFDSSTPITGPVWWFASATGVRVIGTLAIAAALLLRRRIAFALSLAGAVLITSTIPTFGLWAVVIVALSLAALCLWQEGPACAPLPLLAAGGLLLAMTSGLGDYDMNPRAAWAAFAALAGAMFASVAGSLWRGRRAATAVTGGGVVALALAVLGAAGALVAGPVLAAAFALVLVTTRRFAGTRRLAVIAGTLAVAAVGCTAAAARAVERHHFHLYTSNSDIVAPDDYDVWHRVATATPPNSLVFTDFGGVPRESFLYPAIGDRQLYLGGWVYSPLWLDGGRLKREERVNDAVLRGAREPRSIPGAESFSAYFAVVTRSRAVPRDFRLVYRNATWALYRIEAA